MCGKTLGCQCKVDQDDGTSARKTLADILSINPGLTLSLLRVINVKIPLQPHKKYDITQYGELDFS